MSKFGLILAAFLLLFPCFVTADAEYVWYKEILGYTSNYWLSEMAVDKDGKLWVLNNGRVFHLNGDIWEDYTDKAGGATHISISPDGVLWFADKTRLIRYDGFKWDYFEFEGGEIDGEPSRFSAAPNNVVWFCKINQNAESRTLVRFDNGKFDTFAEDFLNPTIGVLTATKGGGVWIHFSTFGAFDCVGDYCPKGVSYFDGVTLTHYLKNDTLPGSGVSFMALSPENKDVYGLCSGNIVRFSNGKWEIIYKGSNDSIMYEGIMVNGGDKNIWQGYIGNRNNNYLMCLKKGMLINYDTSGIKSQIYNEMTNPYLYSIAVTSDGSVWMSFKTGLLRINPNSLKVITSVKSENPVAISDKISCYPNPFNSSATIKYYLDKDSPISVEIYNSVGQKIRTVLSRSMKSGFNFSTWDGFSDKGERVSTGFYTVVVRYSGKMMSSRVLFLK